MRPDTSICFQLNHALEALKTRQQLPCRRGAFMAFKGLFLSCTVLQTVRKSTCLSVRRTRLDDIGEGQKGGGGRTRRNSRPCSAPQTVRNQTAKLLKVSKLPNGETIMTNDRYDSHLYPISATPTVTRHQICANVCLFLQLFSVFILFFYD